MSAKKLTEAQLQTARRLFVEFSPYLWRTIRRRLYVRGQWEANEERGQSATGFAWQILCAMVRRGVILKWWKPVLVRTVLDRVRRGSNFGSKPGANCGCPESEKLTSGARSPKNPLQWPLAHLSAVYPGCGALGVAAELLTDHREADPAAEAQARHDAEVWMSTMLPRVRKIVQARSQGASFSEASAAAGVSEKTARKWLSDERARYEQLTA